MDWKCWSDVASTLGGFATVLTLPIAAGALVVGARQITAASAVSREEGARQALRDYLKLCIDEPQLSSWDIFQKAYPDVRPETIRDVLLPETERYLWFLSAMLSMCEEVAAFVSAKRKWREILIYHVDLHFEAIEALWPRWKGSYSRQLKSIVEEVRVRRQERLSMPTPA